MSNLVLPSQATSRDPAVRWARVHPAATPERMENVDEPPTPHAKQRREEFHWGIQYRSWHGGQRIACTIERRAPVPNRKGHYVSSIPRRCVRRSYPLSHSHEPPKVATFMRRVPVNDWFNRVARNYSAKVAQRRGAAGAAVGFVDAWRVVPQSVPDDDTISF